MSVKILVTGANGFVGRRICPVLGKEGHEVRRAVRANDNLPDTIEMSDSSSENTLIAACAGVDCVISLAGTAHVRGKVDVVLHNDYWSINVDFPLRLAEAAHKVGVRRFIFVSTVKVYGDMSNGRALTETDKEQPNDPYAYSKWAAEQKLRAFSETTGLELVIVRSPLIYGPGVRANFLALLSAVSKGLPLPFLWSTNKRSMIYVDNFASALSACATHPQALQETFNVADANPLTLPALVNELAFALGRRACLFPLPRLFLRIAAAAVGRGQQLKRLTNELEVDSSKIRRMLGWVPLYSFREGIRKTVDGYLHGIHQRDDGF
jgi:UDP-glucose 4-epimerase